MAVDDIRQRIADALREAAVDRTSSSIDSQVEAVLSLPGIAIVETGILRDAGEFIAAAAGSAFSHDLAEALLAAANSVDGAQ